VLKSSNIQKSQLYQTWLSLWTGLQKGFWSRPISLIGLQQGKPDISCVCSQTCLVPRTCPVSYLTSPPFSQDPHNWFEFLNITDLCDHVKSLEVCLSHWMIDDQSKKLRWCERHLFWRSSFIFCWVVLWNLKRIYLWSRPFPSLNISALLRSPSRILVQIREVGSKRNLSLMFIKIKSLSFEEK
jgi:hypothetical protein